MINGLLKGGNVPFSNIRYACIFAKQKCGFNNVKRKENVVVFE